jgi:hypothetical protein
MPPQTITDTDATPLAPLAAPPGVARLGQPANAPARQSQERKKTDSCYNPGADEVICGFALAVSAPGDVAGGVLVSMLFQTTDQLGGPESKLTP